MRISTHGCTVLLVNQPVQWGLWYCTIDRNGSRSHSDALEIDSLNYIVYSVKICSPYPVGCFGSSYRFKKGFWCMKVQAMCFSSSFMHVKSSDANRIWQFQQYIYMASIFLSLRVIAWILDTIHFMLRVSNFSFWKLDTLLIIRHKTRLENLLLRYFLTYKILAFFVLKRNTLRYIKTINIRSICFF